MLAMVEFGAELLHQMADSLRGRVAALCNTIEDEATVARLVANKLEFGVSAYAYGTNPPQYISTDCDFKLQRVLF